VATLFWKDEDEVDGVAIGPAVLVDDDTDAEDDLGWMTESQARATARNMGITVEVG
jgi:hypothetical protein